MKWSNKIVRCMYRIMHEYGLFTPPPSGLEAYCHTGPVRWVGVWLPDFLKLIYMSESAWQIFSTRSCMELWRHEVVQCNGNFPIWPIWACSWAKNFPPIGSRLWRMHRSETAGWIYSIQGLMDLFRAVVVKHHSNLGIWPIWACPWRKN